MIIYLKNLNYLNFPTFSGSCYKKMTMVFLIKHFTSVEVWYKNINIYYWKIIISGIHLTSNAFVPTYLLKELTATESTGELDLGKLQKSNWRKQSFVNEKKRTPKDKEVWLVLGWKDRSSLGFLDLLPVYLKGLRSEDIYKIQGRQVNNKQYLSAQY